MKVLARPSALEIGVATALGIVFLGSVPAGDPQGSLDALGWALLLANTLPLLGLRRNPLAVLLCFCLAYPFWVALEYPVHLLQSLPTLVAMGAVGAAQRPLWWRAIALVQPVEMMAFVIVGPWDDAEPLEIGYVAIVFIIVWAFGVALAERREHARALEEKTVALQAAQEELARRAVVEERTRIARDLHDIVAHAMSLITVQAGVGAHLIDRDPEQAGKALRVIEETGRTALNEMRRVLQAMRSDEASTEPQPSLSSLQELAAHIESAGTPVALRIEGDARPLPAGLQVSAYRIAQEALTNTVKHAPGSRATLTLRYLPTMLEVEVVNVGRRIDPASSGVGHGLKGMRERVALYGGSLDAGPCDGGFRVYAALPVDSP